MQRGIPGVSVLRRSVAVVTAVATGAALAVIGLGTAASATDHDGAQQGGGGQGSGQASAAVKSGGSSVGLYVYLKRDPSIRGSWPNSTQQYFVTAWEGTTFDFVPVTLESAQAAVDAAGLVVCGPGMWGIQEDIVHGGVEIFTDNPAPSYPDSWIGWYTAGGPIYDAWHGNLDEFVTVPECDAATPAPTATPEAPAAAPTPVVSVAPATPSATPTPTASPSTGVTEVLAAPSPSATATSSVVTQVLADETAGKAAGAQLASTGAAPLAGAVAAVLLLAAGGVLLVLRRRGAAR
ncbi:hypothetical protein CSO01_04210 [Cellulomonas soli]|uniref:Gram-positive cocci surface proteins LPxTG domain-containing protein n=1 Tax=Cellulomonas soli TaxID=931535 RepID=A0A512P927_9CELL|nr:hypothetical protein CSO01_04210 [Cellulomonas soli]